MDTMLLTSAAPQQDGTVGRLPSTAITLAMAIAASIILGMAGLPGHGDRQQVIATPAQSGVEA